MYVRALTAEQINDAVSAETVNGLVSEATVNGLVSEATVNGLVSTATVNGLVSTATVNSLVSAATVNSLVSAATVNGLIDRGFVKVGRVLVSANSEISLNLGATVSGAVASFNELDDVETACGVTWSGSSITIRNSSGSQQYISYVAVVSV